MRYNGMFMSEPVYQEYFNHLPKLKERCFVDYDDYQKLSNLFNKMSELVGRNNIRPKEELIKDYNQLVGDQ